MSDTGEPRDTKPQPEPQARNEREKVGDILRKERVTRRITVDTIAKDLKLNVNYIKAIEENDYNNLPADPYVRVYLRSIATYLMLDAEDILKKFYDDKGEKQLTYEEERSTRINISMEKKDKPNTQWILIGIIVLVLAIVGYIANRAGLISPATDDEPKTEQTGEADNDEELFDSTDGARPVTDVGMDSAAIEPQPAKLQNKPAPEETSPAAAPQDSMKLVISVKKDSVWVHIFSDGISWRNFIYPKAPRVFAAVDSFNVHVGHNQLARYSLNGKPLKIKPKGVVIFKLDRAGHKLWKPKKWYNVFKGRG